MVGSVDQDSNFDGGTAPTTTTEGTLSVDAALKRNSDDPGWDYGTLCDPLNKDAIKCRLCGFICKAGITKLKYHVAGLKGKGVAICKNASKEDKAVCVALLEKPKEKKKEKRIREEEMRAEVEIEAEDNVFNAGSKRKKLNLGPLDKFVNPINLEVPILNTRQQNILDAISKERTHSVHQFCARWIYESGIPFHSIDNDAFKMFVEAVGQYGRGYRPPSQYQLRQPLLTEEVERTKGLLKKQEEEWSRNGCSVTTDGWTDQKRRSIMNFCVNSREGTTFLSSVECSKDAHTGQFIFDYVDKCIEDVGPQNVIQVVTDNAANNMSAANKLINKRPQMFWTSCAAHTIDLMLEAIGKEGKFQEWIAKAKALTIFIYAHHRTLALMRKFTKCKDIVRPGVTRFATSFLTLQSLMEKKEKLRLMFTSDEWTQSKWQKTKKGKEAYANVISRSFWNGLNLCLKVISPLVRVLRLVDGDRKPSMGFLYGELEQAKKDIKMAFNNVESNYRPIIEIIETRAKGRLDSPLHMTAYLLNPYYFFKDQGIKDNVMVSDAVFTCLEKFFLGDIDKQDQVINIDLPKYKVKGADFGRPLAAKGCLENNDSYDPGTWWMTYGNATPTLQKMAIKILSLTTSSSGCERNWSAFEGIHTKKRNRLDSQRLHDLVFVQFNSKLINKWVRVKNKNTNVLSSPDASKAQSWLVAITDDDEEMEEGDSLDVGGEAIGDVNVPPKTRELHDDDFVSDEEQVESEEDFECNFGEEGFVETIEDDWQE